MALRVHSLLLALRTVATAEGLGHLALTPTPFRCSVVLVCKREELVEAGDAQRALPPVITWC